MCMSLLIIWETLLFVPSKDNRKDAWLIMDTVNGVHILEKILKLRIEIWSPTYSVLRPVDSQTFRGQFWYAYLVDLVLA